MWVNEGFGRAGERVGEEGRAENGERARRATGRGGRGERAESDGRERARARARARASSIMMAIELESCRTRISNGEMRFSAISFGPCSAMRAACSALVSPRERALHRLRARQVGLAVRGVVVVARHVHRAAALLLVEQLAL